MHIPHTAATPLGRCSINGFLAAVALALGDLGPPIALLHVAWNEWCLIWSWQGLIDVGLGSLLAERVIASMGTRSTGPESNKHQMD